MMILMIWRSNSIAQLLYILMKRCPTLKVALSRDFREDSTVQQNPTQNESENFEALVKLIFNFRFPTWTSASTALDSFR